MGCCQSNIEIGEMIVSTLDNLNMHDPRLIQTEEGFDDLSLDSHHDNKYDPIFETSKTRLGDSLLSYKRTTSLSLHRTDIETAFLQSDWALKKLLLGNNDLNDH